MIDDISLTTYLLAISETSTPDFTFAVSPNPAHQSMTVRYSLADAEGALDVFDLLGQKVIAAHSLADHAQVDISALAPGLYTVVLNAGGVVKVQKLQIE